MTQPRRRAAMAVGVWSSFVIAALIVTLNSLGHHDFDGLNNGFQIPFALPWFLLPARTRDHVVDAWITAGMGFVNAAILYFVLARRSEVPGRSDTQ